MQTTDGATAQAQEKAQEVAGQAKEQATQAAGQAKTQLKTQVDQRSTQAGEQISTQASDIRSVGQQLREQGKEGPAKVADQAAERIEKVGSYLTEANADRILHDVEDFARQRPWAVIAGGAAVGFLASRFLKASSSDRFETRSTSGQLQGRYSDTGVYGTPGVPATGTGYGTAGTGYGTTGTGYGTGNELSSGVGAPRTDPLPATPPVAPVTGGL